MPPPIIRVILYVKNAGKVAEAGSRQQVAGSRGQVAEIDI